MIEHVLKVCDTGDIPIQRLVEMYRTHKHLLHARDTRDIPIQRLVELCPNPKPPVRLQRTLKRSFHGGDAGGVPTRDFDVKEFFSCK